jgi:flagellar hook assembly protein FlgD
VEITISPGTSRGVLVFSSGYEGFHYDPASRRASLEIGDSLLPGTQTMSIVASDLLGKTDSAEVHFRVSAGLELTDIVNSPNPFSGSTEFTFALTRAAEVRIDVYDLNGKRVKTVGPVTGAVGFNRIMWDGLSDAGRPLANGVYLYRITASNTSGSKTMVEKLAILR